LQALAYDLSQTLPARPVLVLELTPELTLELALELTNSPVCSQHAMKAPPTCPIFDIRYSIFDIRWIMDHAKEMVLH
jgi:hypothetical protein